MTISRMTIDKLGVKLYDRVSAVVAELIANSYDADATDVKVHAPTNKYLATKQSGTLVDKGYEIRVEDDGIGMTSEEVNSFYLDVGAERRNDDRRGDRSKIYNRRVMGRKGIGKLAPFGICEEVEVITSGGDRQKGEDENGQVIEGYQTAHLHLKYDEILQDRDEDYNPKPGKLDGVTRPKSGTTIILTDFSQRKVPSLDTFERQVAQRFGIAKPDWQIEIHDTKEDGSQHRRVGTLDIPLMPSTQVYFEADETDSFSGAGRNLTPAKDASRTPYDDILSGFSYEGRVYPIRGWVGYSKKPYKDDLMAGIRIYCRGKIAAQTNVFNLKAGFTGEYDVRSYLVGELHANWLDEEEDLIQTDRRDILWSHDLCRRFEEWGQKVVKKVGRLSRNPLKRKAWDHFQEVAEVDDAVARAYPNPNQEAIRKNARDLARTIGESVREEQEDESIHALMRLALTLAPHVTLDEKLREAAGAVDSPLEAAVEILKTARVAELSSFGQIADDRVKVIDTVKKLKEEPASSEGDFQALIESAPWLIDPQWSPVTENESFNTLKRQFEEFYEREHGESIDLADFSKSNKRPDFVMSAQGKEVQVIEIKRPGHKLRNEEMDRIINYIDSMSEFLDAPGQEEFKSDFDDFHVTLVCDELGLDGAQKHSFNGFVSDERLTHIRWDVFLLRTRKTHQEFLEEARRQKRLADENF